MSRNDRPQHALRGVKPAALLVLGTTLLASAPALANEWYVDGAYGNNYGSGNYSNPYRDIWRALQSAQGGDFIYLKPTTTYSSVYVTKGGWYGSPITIAGLGSGGGRTRVNGYGHGFGVWIGANYVTISNLDITSSGLWSGLHVQDNQHHITITNNNVHDAGGDGIDLVGDDYVTISYNTVYGNARATWNGIFGSGISVKGGHDIDGNSGQKVLITGNTVFNNTNVPSCNNNYCWDTTTNSDGSGIIIDNNRRTYSDNNAYRGGFLITNNVVSGNGGRGIHLYQSDNITINGNTLFHNNQDPYEGAYLPGEITGYNVSNVNVVNNILDSDGGYGYHTGQRKSVSFMYCNYGQGITIQHNLGYDPQNNQSNFLSTQQNSIYVNSFYNSWGDPAFVNVYNGDFRIKSWSPALRNGLNNTGLNQDITGAARYSPVTIGAYQNAAY